MSDTQHSVWTYPPTGEERQQLAEQLRQRDEMQRVNDSVPTFENADLSRGAPRKVATFSDKVYASAPVPVSPKFYAKHGSARAGSAAEPGDVVDVPLGNGQVYQMEVESALRMGLIARDPAGGYRGLDAAERGDMATQERQEQQQEQTEAAAELEALRATGDAADVDTSRLIDAVVRFVPGHAVASLAHDIVTNNGTLSETGVARAAEAAGWTTEQGKRVVSSLYEGLSRQAAVAVTSQGVPAAEVEAAYAWMAQVDPVAHKHATLNLIHNSDATELKRLAKAYYRARVVRQNT